MKSLDEINREILQRLETGTYRNAPKPSIIGNGKKKLQQGSTQTNLTKEICSCGGAGWLIGNNGELVRCGKCTNLLKVSRLTEEEQAARIDDITTRMDDKYGEGLALRFLAKEMLRDPFGFLTIWGTPGNAKSLLLVALVAEFCRSGRQAVYVNADDLVALLSPGEDTEVDGFRYVPGNPDANLNRLKSTPVLALDEMDKLKWSDWQVQKIGALIEYRHRQSEKLVTLFAMNKHPSQWSNAGSIGHLTDRWMDGRFNRYWPEGQERFLPACLDQFKENVGGVTRYFAPGFFHATLPSMRSAQRRYVPLAQSPVNGKEMVR